LVELQFFIFILILKVVEMEADILKSLEFELGDPTIKTFLRQVQWSIFYCCNCEKCAALAWFDNL